MERSFGCRLDRFRMCAFPSLGRCRMCGAYAAIGIDDRLAGTYALQSRLTGHRYHFPRWHRPATAEVTDSLTGQTPALVRGIGGGIFRAGAIGALSHFDKRRTW